MFRFVALPAPPETNEGPRVAGELQRAVVDAVDGDVAAQAPVVEVAPGAAAEQLRELTRERRTDVCDEARLERRWRRELAVARGEVDVLREVALRADRVRRILTVARRPRQGAVQEELQVDGLRVEAREIQVEGHHGHGQVGPHGHVGEGGGRGRVVDGEKRRDAGRRRPVRIDLEVRQQQRRGRHLVHRPDHGVGRASGHEHCGQCQRQREHPHHTTPPRHAYSPWAEPAP
jgi:hypothetical protein